MKRHYLHLLALLFSLSSVSNGQSIDLGTEKFPGTKKLIVNSFNGCCAQKGYRKIYLFDSTGRIIKSYNYFKRQHLASFEYRYNEKGLLYEKILTYDINSKTRKDTTKFQYSFDPKDRITCMTEYFGNRISQKSYSDFDSLNNTTTIKYTFNNNRFTEKRLYNSLGQLIFNQRLKNDTIVYAEEIKYNLYGDIIYSNVPTLLDKETGKMVSHIGGTRHWYIEEYNYTYDKLNRWTEKYVMYDNKKVLIEKRIYK
jgi:hypothetical protein